APSHYYGQAFVVHSAGFMLVMLLLGALYGVVVWPGLTLPFMLVVGLMFLAYAGVAFLLSAAARWDWLSLVVVSVAATFLWTKFGGGGAPPRPAVDFSPARH